MICPIWHAATRSRPSPQVSPRAREARARAEARAARVLGAADRENIIWGGHVGARGWGRRARARPRGRPAPPRAPPNAPEDAAGGAPAGAAGGAAAFGASIGGARGPPRAGRRAGVGKGRFCGRPERPAARVAPAPGGCGEGLRGYRHTARRRPAARRPPPPGHAAAPTAMLGDAQHQAKLVLLGDMGAGKSSLVLRFVKGQFHDYQVGERGGVWGRDGGGGARRGGGGAPRGPGRGAPGRRRRASIARPRQGSVARSRPGRATRAPVEPAGARAPRAVSPRRGTPGGRAGRRHALETSRWCRAEGARGPTRHRFSPSPLPFSSGVDHRRRIPDQDDA